MFDMMEQDESGDIAIEDAVNFMLSSGYKDASIAEVSAKYDEDGNGSIDLQEFTEIYRDLQAQKRETIKKLANEKNERDLTGGNSPYSKQRRVKNKDAGEEEGVTCCEFVRTISMTGMVTETVRLANVLAMGAMSALHPNSAPAFRWTMFTLMWVVYSSFLVPARLGFDSEEHAGAFGIALDYLLDVWFVIDIFLNFRMGYKDNETDDIVMDLTKIRSHYVRSWFIPDFVSSIPWNFLTLLQPSLADLRFLKMLRLLKLFRMLKLLRIKTLEELEDCGAVSPSFVRICKLAFAFCFIMHITACIYWGTVRSSCEILCRYDGSDISGCIDPQYDEGWSSDADMSFATPEFCPPVWRVSNRYWGSGEPSSSLVNGLNVTDAPFIPDAPDLTDMYLDAIYFAIITMLGEDSAPSSNAQLVFSITAAM
jgi:hypothetical protein